MRLFRLSIRVRSKSSLKMPAGTDGKPAPAPISARRAPFGISAFKRVRLSTKWVTATPLGSVTAVRFTLLL